MDLARKLQLAPGRLVAVLGAPADVDLGDLPVDPSGTAVLAFVRMQADLEGADASVAIAAARGDRLAWLAYPKGGALGTDLNRDRLAAALTALGARPVRQVAIDDTWSALRFRPA
ncbi:MAG TPA: hypothetical protein VIG76_02540 [Amnibacterium sp.]|jgi:hypothetical protein|uniref:hypothetical protein n=1 Tax=Amnibacterium sp. TaxID=1872496 RepID=UPI002F94FABF